MKREVIEVTVVGAGGPQENNVSPQVRNDWGKEKKEREKTVALLNSRLTLILILVNVIDVCMH